VFVEVLWGVSRTPPASPPPRQPERLRRLLARDREQQPFFIDG